MVGKKAKPMLYTISIILALIALYVLFYLGLPKFGRSPQGERLERIERSAAYSNGEFRNVERTPQLTSDKGRFRVMIDFLFESRERNRPTGVLPAVRTDLHALDTADELVVWFGHSSYYIQSAGRRILVDPVFEDAAPISFINRAFDGTNIYSAADIPEIDYLIITHDHWDHLDYETVTALKDRTAKVICPLGVGEHFEYWGFALNKIVELDWNESHRVDSTLAIHALTARHFSGRTFRSNQTLWASFMIQSATSTIFLSGDTGYGAHFKQIAERFPSIDLALMENGQYNADWRYIHLMPEHLEQAIADLAARHVITGHNSKYALAKHAWDEPLDRAAKIKTVLTPQIGQVIKLNNSTTIATEKWWDESM